MMMMKIKKKQRVLQEGKIICKRWDTDLWKGKSRFHDRMIPKLQQFPTKSRE